jgi:hypothetical protein
MKWSTCKIGFDEEDHPISTRGMGIVPILCTPTINNVAVNRTLIDRGAGLNIISVEIFEKMQVPYHLLMPTRPFFGVTKGSTMPIGQVNLPVTFGTRDNYRTESLDFNVAYIALPYNAILGYPALARFMAATHHGFNVLKISGANGTITVHCNEKDALCSVEHVYREAASMFPADEDLLEHSGDLTRKQQLVSQERAAAKKASLEPHLVGSTGKKFAAYSKRGPGPSNAGCEHWGSCGTLRSEAPVYPRALGHQEGPSAGWGLRELRHHWGRAFPQIGKRAHHLPAGKF